MPANQPHTEQGPKGTEVMLKALVWIIAIIFLIGLLVVLGFFKLIF